MRVLLLPTSEHGIPQNTAFHKHNYHILSIKGALRYTSSAKEITSRTSPPPLHSEFTQDHIFVVRWITMMPSAALYSLAWLLIASLALTPTKIDGAALPSTPSKKLLLVGKAKSGCSIAAIGFAETSKYLPVCAPHPLLESLPSQPEKPSLAAAQGASRCCAVSELLMSRH